MGQPNWIGQQLGGRYIIEELIGQGGMSSVYKATDPNLRRVVAIKLIHPHLSNNTDFVRRFEEEAAAVAQLNHPNIIKVYDFNVDGDVYYMVLEFVPGETLQDRLKRLNQQERRMSNSEVVDITSSMCDALGYAHKRNMLHRDIKPANIMLSTEGRAVLMDFGVVKMMGGQQHTATGAVIGTALYMSPEQARGEHPDTRADIYSLGVTLFEMVSGRPPFEADSAMSTLLMHVTDPIPDIQALNPDVPDGLKAVIDRALAKSADDRFQTMEEMGAALRASLSGGQAAPVGATMIEEPPAQAGPAATYIEQPSPDSDFGAAGTMIEEPVEMGTAVSAPNPQADISTAVSPGATAPQSAPPARQTGGAASAGRKLPAVPIIVGVAVIGLIVVVGGIVLFSGMLGGGGRNSQGAGGEEETAVAVVATDIPTNTPLPQPTATDLPTEIPTPAETATPTVPPGIHYVRINNITVENGFYQVYYEAFEYTPQLPGEHIHFFFNTVPEDLAGVPGPGNWIIYAGPIPFTGYATGDRPAEATQMCALVANPDHTIQPGSGNCFDLP